MAASNASRDHRGHASAASGCAPTGLALRGNPAATGANEQQRGISIPKSDLRRKGGCRMPTDTPRRRPCTRAEIARAHRNTTAGIVRDYLTAHFEPDHVITHEVQDGRDTFYVRTRADRRTVHTLLVDLLVLDVHEGRLYKLADLLAYLQAAHHLGKVGAAALRINDRCELCEAHTGRVLALPPGRLAVYGREPVAGKA